MVNSKNGIPRCRVSDHVGRRDRCARGHSDRPSALGRGRSDCHTGTQPPDQRRRVCSGCDLAGLDRAYEARLAEIHPELHPPGSPERQSIEAQRTVIVEAYERLRDAINITETRFEKLELDT